jgi:polyferredoxin
MKHKKTDTQVRYAGCSILYKVLWFLFWSGDDDDSNNFKSYLNFWSSAGNLFISKFNIKEFDFMPLSVFIYFVWIFFPYAELTDLFF